MNGNNYHYNNYYNHYNANNYNWKEAEIASDIENGSFCDNPMEQQMRLGFIRKVYGILSAQMLLTTLMCILSITIPAFAKFQIHNHWLIYVCLAGTIGIMIALCCFREVARRVPTNYILLTFFTLFEGYIVSAVCATTRPDIVLMAAVMTCAVTIALTVYACTTKTDFTVFGSFLFIASCMMLLFGLFVMFTHNKVIYIIYSCLGVIFYSVYLIYDTQLIVGDKSRAIGVDDYIYGALMLYIDIINLFLHILRLLKHSSE
jgi:FtsH-binding integral membrane protein